MNRTSPSLRAKLPPAFRPALKILLAVALAFSMFGAWGTVRAQAASTPVTLDTVFGPVRPNFLAALSTSKGILIGTPYEAWDASKGDPDLDEGPWWPKGSASETGHVGMNDAGFVARAILCNWGGVENKALINNWFNNGSGTLSGTRKGRWANLDTLYELLVASNVKQLTFATKEAMLASDLLQKGDIIFMMCDGTDNGGTDEFGQKHACGHSSHVGFFWGETSDEDKLWHSNDVYYGATQSEQLTGNHISTIQPNCYGCTYQVFKWSDVGELHVWKRSTNPLLASGGNKCYSFTGADWIQSVYEDCSRSNGSFGISGIYAAIDSLKPEGATGHGSPAAIYVGMNYVREWKAAPGYLKDDAIYPVDIIIYNSGPKDASNVVSNAVPKYNPASSLLSVYDADISGTPSGDAVLYGAQYQIDYYDGYYDTVAAAEESGAPFKTWTVQTDGDGVVRYDANATSFQAPDAGSHAGERLNYLVSGPAFYTHTDGSLILPLGTYVTRAVKAPEGYELSDEEPHIQVIRNDDATVAALDEFEAPSFALTPQRGGLRLSVIDAHIVAAMEKPQLQGAMFEVRNASAYAVKVGTQIYAPGETVLTLTTNAQGYAESASDALPFGTYEIRQTQAPAGYEISYGDWTSFSVSEESLANPYPNAVSVETRKASVEVAVVDAETGLATPQGDASLAGATFAVTNAGTGPLLVEGRVCEPGAKAVELVTGEDGVARSETVLPLGMYKVCQVSAGTGYRLIDGEAHTFTLDTEGEVAVPFADTPWRVEPVRGGLTAQKHDADTRGALAQGDASLAGATLEVINRSTGAVWNGESLCASGEVVLTLETDENGHAASDAYALPYGTYTVREAAASAGYVTNNLESIQVKVRKQGVAEQTLEGQNALTGYVVRGSVQACVIDAETGTSESLGAASLEGAVLSVTNASARAIWLNDAPLDPDFRVCTAVTGTNGVAQTDCALPYGTYDVQLTAAPAGYRLKAVETGRATVRDTSAAVAAPSGAEGFTLQVVRGDITLQKYDSNGKPLAGVPFRITSAATGESHVIVTNSRGIASTAVSAAPHSRDTNGNDNGEPYDASRGVWFGLRADGSLTAPDDGLGALPYDTYAVEELPCEANEGAALAGGTLEMLGEGKEVEADASGGGLSAVTPPALAVHVQGAGTDGTVTLGAGDSPLVLEVTFEGLTPGEEYLAEVYPVVWEQQDDGTIAQVPLRDADGNPVVLRQPFTPKTASGTLALAVPAGIELEGKALGFTNALYQAPSFDEPLSACDDALASGAPVQVVSQPSIATSAVSAAGATKVIPAQADAGIVDTVSYRGLRIGERYTLTATLMAMDGVTATPLTSGGAPVAATVAFVPEYAEGAVNVSLGFDATKLGGQSFVVYEVLRLDGAEVASHCDPADAAQTVSVRAATLSTLAYDEIDNDKAVAAAPGQRITDTLSFQGLVAGRTYTVRGALMLRTPQTASTGKVLAEPLQVGGESVEISAQFTPETADGEVSVTFDVDATGLAGRQLVAYEEIFDGDTAVASHLDPADLAQTVDVRAVSLNAVSITSDGGTRKLIPGESQTIDTRITYEGLETGETYALLAVALDPDTGLPFQNGWSAEEYDAVVVPLWSSLRAILTNQDAEDALGEIAELLAGYDTERLPLSLVSFVPDSPSGDVCAQTMLRTWGASGKSVSMQTYLLKTGEPVAASFSDINDPDQRLECALPALTAESYGMPGEGGFVAADEGRVLRVHLTAANVEPDNDFEVILILTDTATGLPLGMAADALPGVGLPLASASHTFRRLVESASQEGADALAAALTSQSDAMALDAWTGCRIRCDKGTEAAEDVVDATFDAWPYAGKKVRAAAYLFDPTGALLAADDATAAGSAVEVVRASVTSQAVDAASGSKTALPGPDTAVQNSLSHMGLSTDITYRAVTLLMDADTGLPLGLGAIESPSAAGDEGVPEAEKTGAELEAAFEAEAAQANDTEDDAEDATEEEVEAEASDNAVAGEAEDAAPVAPGPAAVFWQALETALTGRAATDAYGTLQSLLAQNPSYATLLAFGETLWQPESATGEVQVVTSFDAPTALACDTEHIVAFSYVYDERGRLIASHTDANDFGQTISLVRPTLSTTARGASGEGHAIAPLSEAVIIDEVTYTGLTPGATYELRGTLMDKGSGVPLVIGSSTVTGAVNLVPEASEGTCKVAFTFNAAGLDESELVVFETLTLDGRRVASHCDLLDSGQTVLVTKSAVSADEKDRYLAAKEGGDDEDKAQNGDKDTSDGGSAGNAKNQGYDKTGVTVFGWMLAIGLLTAGASLALLIALRPARGRRPTKRRA